MKLILIATFVILLGVIFGRTLFTKGEAGKPVSAVNNLVGSEKKYEKEEGNVTVAITEKDTGVFEVDLNTHSENLDGFDFVRDIHIEKNSNVYSPTLVEQSGSTHHRKATLSFKNVSKPFTMSVENLAGVDKREFKITN